MKKLLVILLVSALAVSMLLLGTSCAETAVVEETTTAAITESAETTSAETTSAETTAAETTTEDNSAIDPWIKGLWDEVEQYREGTLDPAFKGPNGETVTWDRDSLPLTIAEVEKIKAGNYKVGLPWASLQGDYFAAWQQGTHDACEYLNLEIVAETDAGWDANKQLSDVESMVQLKPDVLISAPTDATSGTAIYQPAVDAGVLLSIVSVIPKGYERGKEYIGVSTANAYGLGITACDLALELLGKGGKIGQLTWSNEYWYTNYHDKVFRDNVVSEKYGLELIDVLPFLSSEDAYSAVSALIMNHPDVEGIYISYMIPAEAGAEACVAANRPDIKIITGSYDSPTLINLASGGNIAGFFTDTTYLVGVNSVLVAAYGLLGKEGPEYTVCPTLPLTRENLRETWELITRTPLPEEVDKALTEAGY